MRSTMRITAIRFARAGERCRETLASGDGGESDFDPNHGLPAHHYRGQPGGHLGPGYPAGADQYAAIECTTECTTECTERTAGAGTASVQQGRARSDDGADRAL